MGAALINSIAIAEAVLLRLSDERCPLPGPLRLSRDLEPLVSHRLSAPVWRQMLDDTVVALAAKDYISMHRQHFHATPKGHRWRDERFGCCIPHHAHWHELRDVHLVGRALGVSKSPLKLHALLSAEGLRRLVLENTFGIKLKQSDSVSGMRDVLARLALRRGTVTGNLARSTHLLDASSRRAQAASLIGRKSAPATDHRLIAVLAADQIGAIGTSPADLRLQLLRRYMSGKPLVSRPVPAPPQSRFDFGDFLLEVRNFARQCAQGWHGNRRALISRVFPVLADAHPEWGLDVTRFKTLLAEAHKAGRLHLVHADLRDKKLLDDLRDSALAYQNMILHFIRVEDENSDAA